MYFFNIREFRPAHLYRLGTLEPMKREGCVGSARIVVGGKHSISIDCLNVHMLLTLPGQWGVGCCRG